MRILRTLHFQIDACPGSPLLRDSEMARRDAGSACACDPAVHEFRKKLARRFKLKQNGLWLLAPWESSLAQLLDHVGELADAGIARVVEGSVTEKIDFSDGFDWYHLAPVHGFTPKHRKDGATHLLGEYGSVYASGAFRRAAEAAGLRGLAFAVL